MEKIEKWIVFLYIVTIGVIVVGFSDLIILAASFMLIILIIIFQKIYVDNQNQKLTKKIDFLSTIGDRIDVLAKTLDMLIEEARENTSNMHTRVSEIRNDYLKEMEKHYQELTRKIVFVDSRINEIRKTLGIVYAAVDERLQTVERQERKEDL